MNSALGILHGEQALVGIGLAGLIVIIAVPVLLYVWLWHTKVPPLNVAVVYFVAAALLDTVLLFTTYDSISLFSLTAYCLGFFLSLPWSAIGALAIYEARTSVLSDRQYVLLMVAGAGVNAVLLYFAAVKMRRLIAPE